MWIVSAFIVGVAFGFILAPKGWRKFSLVWPNYAPLSEREIFDIAWLRSSGCHCAQPDIQEAGSHARCRACGTETDLPKRAIAA